MRKVTSIVVLILLLISSIQIVGSNSLYIETDVFSGDLSEYFDDNFVSLDIDENEHSLPNLDMSSIPTDFTTGHFFVDSNGKYVDTVDLTSLNSLESPSGNLLMTSNSNEVGTTDTTQEGDDSYNPDEGDDQDDPDGVIGCSMDFIDFPPMTKGDTCGKSEREIMREYRAASVIDPDGFHIYNPLAFKTFNISHPKSYPDNVDVSYKIEVKYTGENDINLGKIGKGWINVAPKSGELLYNPNSHWWESDAEINEERITVKANITDLLPGRHSVYIIIYSNYYIVDRTIGNTEAVKYRHETIIPVSINVWSDPTTDSSLKYSILGGESAYKYDVGPVRMAAFPYEPESPDLSELLSTPGPIIHYVGTELDVTNEPFSIIVDVWNQGAENTTLFYTVEPDLKASGIHDYVLYSDIIHNFHRIIDNIIIVEPYEYDSEYKPSSFHASQGEHDYLRIKIDLCTWMKVMKSFIDANEQTWEYIFPEVSLSDFTEDVENPNFAFKITSSSGDSFWFEISYSFDWRDEAGQLGVSITELKSYSPNIVPHGEILNFMNIIAWNPCPMGTLATFDTTVYYQLSGVLARVDSDNTDINNPPPQDSWVEGDHVYILPSTGEIEYGGSPGGDTIQNKRGRNLHNFYVDTTDLEPGTYIFYTSWFAECEYWTEMSKDDLNENGEPIFGEEGCQGMGLAPAITPSKCVFTVKPADWTPDESVEIQSFSPQTMALDNLNTSRKQNTGEIFEYIGNNDIVYEYGPEFSELNTKEIKIEKHGECTVIYGEELPNIQVIDDSFMFDIYPKKPFDYTPLPTDTIIIIPRDDYVNGDYTPLSEDPDSSFEERGGTSIIPFAPLTANPFDKYDQLAYINGQMTHIDPPPLYRNIKTQVLNPVTGEWIDVQDPHRRNPEIGDWVGLLQDAPVGSNLTLRIELYIRDLSEYAGFGLHLPSNAGCIEEGMGNIQWPLTVDSILPDNLEYVPDSAKVRLGAWWNNKGSFGCDGENPGGQCGSNCFLEGTQVAMSDNSYKNIEDICVGDFVKSYDEETKTIQYGKVTQIIHHDKSKMTDCYLIINDDLKVTPDHPVYMNGQWISADMLKTGDILSFQDNLYKIYLIEKVFQRVPTFNLEIETYHNYMVQSNNCDVLVHNSFHPEVEGNWFFSWAETFTAFEPEIRSKPNNTKLIWNLPSGTLIQHEKYFNGLTDSWDTNFYLLGQPIEHWKKGYVPLAPYHPTLNYGAGTTGTAAIEIIFNVTVTQDLDEDTIVTSDLFIDNFYDNYYDNHEKSIWLNTDDAKITTRDYNHPPTVEILSPQNGENDISVKTDELIVMIDDPDGDPVSVSFYWTDKPRFKVDIYTGASVNLAYVTEFESATGEQIFGVPSPVATDYELCTHGNRIETVYNVNNGDMITDLDPRPVEYKLAVVDIKRIEMQNPAYYLHYENGSYILDYSDPENPVPIVIENTLYDSNGNPIPRTIYYNKPIYKITPLIKYLEFEDENTNYEWYVEVKDIGSTTRSEINSFTTHKSPRIDFTYTPQEPETKENITFNISNIYDPDHLFLENYIWGWKETLIRDTSNPEKDDTTHNQDVREIDDDETNQDYRYPSGEDDQYLPFHKYSLDGYAIIGTGENIEYSFTKPSSYNVNLKSAYYLYERPIEFQVYDLDTHLGITKSISVTKIITVSEGMESEENTDTENSTPDDNTSEEDNNPEQNGTSPEDNSDQNDTGEGEYVPPEDDTNNNNSDEGQNDDETSRCNIKINKPLKNYLYIKNEKKMPFFIPIVIGDIEVDATITDETTAVSNIKFFFDGEEKENFAFNLNDLTYSYEFNEKTFSWKEIKVEAYDLEGNIIASEKTNAFFFNLH